MKIIALLVTAILLSSLMVFADVVPAIVKKTFDQKFPGAQKEKWELQKNDRCDASFKWNEKKCLASFTVLGEWLRTETILSYKELPLNIKKSINGKYIAGSIKGASKIETPQGVSYGVDFKYGYKPEWTQYTENGTEM